MLLKSLSNRCNGVLSERVDHEGSHQWDGDRRSDSGLLAPKGGTRRTACRIRATTSKRWLRYRLRFGRLRRRRTDGPHPPDPKVGLPSKGTAIRGPTRPHAWRRLDGRNPPTAPRSLYEPPAFRSCGHNLRLAGR